MLLGGRGERRALAARPRRRRPPGSSAPGPRAPGVGETRRNVCRVRANCESAEAGTEGTGETRGDG